MTSNTNSHDIVILSAARTPIGRFLGALGQVEATDLGALAVQAAVERSGIDPGSVYEVIMGNVVAAGTGQAPARQAALNGGLPDTVGASAVNKACGSGLKAVMMAANAIVADEAKVFVAGGMESMSRAPFLLPDARQGQGFGHGRVLDSVLYDGLWCAFQEWAMGNAAEFIARQFEVTRAEMDEYALNSHAKAAAATAAGRFEAEIVPVEVKGRKGKVTVVERDEAIRAKFSNGDYELTTSLELLAKLPPAFEEDGQVTAGNAPGLNDGAAALVVTDRAETQRQGLTPMARVVGYTHAAVNPQWIFAAPARAIPRLLDKIGWSLDDVDLIELNEAFAAQVLADGVELMQKGYHWDWDKVNVNGGAIALGHPIGASGARVLVTLLYALQERGLKRGIASLCLGGGEAVALAVEME
ncbi:MAG: acetyl-CoA C-acyltransferase [Candidatus Promineifilaceae bacterium]|nr:acetyl-CoA C-acyltransferase [Candidatus Promineifilaceae bacterium]